MAPSRATGLLELGGDPAQAVPAARPECRPKPCPPRPTFWPVPMWGRWCWKFRTPKCLDLVASRRLAFAAGESGVTLFLLREGAVPEPSAAADPLAGASAPPQPATMTGARRSSRRS